jgi:DDE superfamily endonuclease
MADWPRPHRACLTARSSQRLRRFGWLVKPVTIVSCDEKPGIQAIATTASDLPPKPGVHATFARDHEYKRHGTLSRLAGIDLLSGKVHARVKDRHRSREFIEFLRLIDAAYLLNTAIELILDNHSAHISREARAWLATRPSGRFELTFTCAYRISNPAILMVQSAQDRAAENASNFLGGA